MTLKSLTLAGALLGASLISSHAAVIAYWDYNDDNIFPEIGTATPDATYVGVGIGSITYLEGTTDNAQPGVAAGDSFSFFDAANVVSQGTFQATAIPLSGDSDVHLSFAFETDHIFQVSDRVRVYYDAGSGWNEVSNLNPTELGVWHVYNFAIPQLDNVASGGFKIVVDSTIDVGKYASFDNVTLSAIPEPSSLALIGATSLGFGFLIARRRARLGKAAAA